MTAPSPVKPLRRMIRPMKTSALLSLLLLLPSAALAVRVAALPFDASDGAISEATTNVPFAVDFGTMSRIEFTLTLDASPTNAVEVSVGTDADVRPAAEGDGRGVESRPRHAARRRRCQ